MRSNKAIAALAVLVIALAAFVFWRQSAKPRVNLRPSSALGEVLADEVGRMLGGGGKIVLIGRAGSRDYADASGQQIGSLEAALKRRAPSNPASVEWLPRPQAGTMDLGGIAPEKFLELVDKNKEAKAFVVFAGLPPFSAELADKINVSSIKLLVVCGYNKNVRSWLESRALAMAVVPRSDDLPAGSSAPKSSMDWFQREFQILTLETVGQLAY